MQKFKITLGSVVVPESRLVQFLKALDGLEEVGHAWNLDGSPDYIKALDYSVSPVSTEGVMTYQEYKIALATKDAEAA